MTTAQIETSARQRLNAVSSTFWSSTEIIESCLYFAVVDLLNRVRCYETTATTTSVASQSAYTKPTGTLGVKRIWYDGQPLELLPEREIDSLNLNATPRAIGRPTNFYEWGSSFYLYPTPDTNGLTIEQRNFSVPTAIASGDTIPVPIQFHPRLVNGVAYYMILKETDDPRIPTFGERWFSVDIPWCVDEWARTKQTAKNARVRTEETLLTNQTGVI